MKVVALIASHSRDAILRDCIKCLKPQVSEIVLVGSSPWVDGTQGCGMAKMIAKQEGLVYVDHTNKCLGEKFQAGLNKCRELKPDAVLICGSDDLLSHDWVESAQISLVPCGVKSWHVYNALTQEMIHTSYTMRKDPVGAGRIINAEMLDLLNWDIFPHEAVGCDLFSYNKMQQYVQGYCEIESDLLCVKGDWTCMDSWEQLVSSPQLNIEFLNPRDICDVMNKFPYIDFEQYESVV